MNLVNILIEIANKNPDAIAFIEGIDSFEKRITFSELLLKSGRVTAILQKAGIKKGDNVLIMVPMSIDLYIVLISLWRIGAAGAFLDPAFGKDYIRQCCSAIAIDGFIGTWEAGVLANLNKDLRSIPVKFSTYKLGLKSIYNNSANIFKETISLEDDFPALITFTSGSTGIPKVAVRTHGFLRKQYEIIKKELDIKPNDIDFNSLPIFALAGLGSGAATVVPHMTSRRIIQTNPKPLVKQFRHYGVNRALMPPALAEKIVEYCEKKAIFLDKVTRFYTGGGPVFEKLINRINKVFPNAKVIVVYGSTEAEPIAETEWNSITKDEIAAVNNGKGLIAGRPIKDINLKILKIQKEKESTYTANEFEENILSINEIGEIIVNGEHVLKGYLKGIGDIDNKIRVGKEIWHRTGDMGFLDEKGQLWLMGRVGTSVENKNGEVIYSFAVENVVNNIAGVKRSALLNYNKECTLVLNAEKGADSKAIDESVLNFGIDRVCFLDKIPLDKRHNSKIDYPALIKTMNKIYKN
ncbi:MAG: AMP-binding protein [Ignavibacteriales bacterium]